MLKKNCSPPIHITNSTVTAVESFIFLGTTISQDLKWDNHIESMVKNAQQRLFFHSPAEEFQPATGAAETVLLCHHWIHPLYVNNCLVQLSYRIWPQKTTEGSPDCWANHWYNPPHSPRTVLIQSEQKGWENHSGPPHIQHTPSLILCHLVDATELCALEWQDTETVSSLRQSISWTLDNKHGTHNTIIHYLFITHTHFLFQICTWQTCTHIIVYIIYCVFTICDPLCHIIELDGVIQLQLSWMKVACLN